MTIRDDGSTDGTCEKIRLYQATHPQLRLMEGENLGAAASFLHLLALASPECDYFAFADQDDVWLPSKLENAISQLARFDASQPLMYCSRVEYVDEQLRHLGYKPIPRQVGFGNALVQNIAAGCTIVLNQEARRVILQRSASRMIMHDWWCYLVVSGLGRVVYDERPSMKYRQHRLNTIGDPTNAVQRVLRSANRFLNYKKVPCKITDQALEFHRCFGDRLSSENSMTLERFLRIRGSVWSRIGYCLQMDVWRQSWLQNVALRTSILVGRV